MLTPICSNCGKRKIIRHLADDPDMLGIQMKDGKTINLCRDCLIELGKMSKSEKKKFMDRLKENAE